MRYRIIDTDCLKSVVGAPDLRSLQLMHQRLVAEELRRGRLSREADWTQSLCVGSKEFVAQIDKLLEGRIKQRNIISYGEQTVLKEQANSYRAHSDSEIGVLRGNKKIKINITPR